MAQQLVPNTKGQSEFARDQFTILSMEVTTMLAPFPAGIIFPGKSAGT
jgi:hypothetical protein